VSNGEVATLFAVDSEVPETGELINPTLEAVGPDGRFAVNAAPRAEPTPRPLVLGVLTIQETPQSFTEITRIGMVRGAETVIRAEVIGTDDQGAVLFLETLEETDSQAEEPPERLALRLFDGASTVDVAVERERLPGSEEFVIELRDPHFNRRGEVALVAELGEIVETPSGPTATVRGTDVLVRSRAGIYTARLPAEESTGGPIIEGTALQDFDDTGTLLAIGAREEENDGLLVLVPPPPDTP
jgi:hypothetical protein